MLVPFPPTGGGTKISLKDQILAGRFGTKKRTNDFTSIWLYQAGIPHIGGCCGQRRTCSNTFAHTLNHLPENDAHARPFTQGIIPDLSVDVTGRELGDQAKKAFGDQGRALFDWKTLAPGKAYSETASTEFAAVANK